MAREHAAPLKNPTGQVWVMKANGQLAQGL